MNQLPVVPSALEWGIEKLARQYPSCTRLVVLNEALRLQVQVVVYARKILQWQVSNARYDAKAMAQEARVGWAKTFVFEWLGATLVPRNPEKDAAVKW